MLLFILIAASPRKDGRTHWSRKDSASFELSHIHNKTIIQILGERKIFKETEELKAEYEDHLKAYEMYHPKVGMQFLATSNAITRGDSYSEHSNIKGHRLVNDQFETDDMPSIIQETSVSFFNEGSLDTEIYDEDMEEAMH